ncbi:hypothetical protein, partial [Oscillibacter sp. CU971]|uniref:hypothetical protein n=1 Tax=Oscillibacter sp. CU971 TaxID=2780102 RepID=UPI00195731AE
LDKVKSLYEGMNWSCRSTEFGLFGKQVSLHPDLDTENRFYCNIDETYLVLLVRNDQPATFYVVPATFRFLYKGIIINHNKKLSQPTLKRRFFKKKAAFFSWPGLGKEWC